MSPTLTTCAASMPHSGHWCLGPWSHMVVLIWKGAEGCSRSQSPWTAVLAGLTWGIVLHFRKAQACVGGKGAGGYCFWEEVALQGQRLCFGL